MIAPKVSEGWFELRGIAAHVGAPMHPPTIVSKAVELTRLLTVRRGCQDGARTVDALR